MAQYDHIGVPRDNADRILQLLSFHLGGEDLGLVGRANPPSQAMHGGLETDPRPGRGFIEEGRHDLVLVVESPTPGHDALHGPRAVEEFEQEGHGELLRFDHVAKVHDQSLLSGKMWVPAFPDHRIRQIVE